MKLAHQSNIHLESFSFKEELNGIPELEVSDVKLDSLNLFIGNNAQGKSRLFRTIKFIKELLRDDRRKIATNFSANFIFSISGDKENVSYELIVRPSNEGNSYIEKIIKGKRVLLSSMDKKLFNEDSGEYIDNFFIPQNIPAISAINEPQFKIIKLIREFFLTMLFIDSKKINEVVIEQNSIIPNALGTNLASVMYSWKDKFPHIYKEIISDFKKCFPIIDNIKFVQGFIPQLGVKTELLAFCEKDIDKYISQNDWSDGMWRALCIICMTKTQFEFSNKFYKPSLICIDEIENGLDFNTLEYITDYLKDYSDSIQIIMSSHSPLMGKFIHPKNWQIVKRKGYKIKISKPSIVEKDLEERLGLYRQEFWDFYANHVSRSHLYEPK